MYNYLFKNKVLNIHIYTMLIYISQTLHLYLHIHIYIMLIIFV